MINPQQLQDRRYDTETVSKLIIFSIIFLINPLLSILSLTFVIINKKGKNEQLFFILYAFLALYLGLINSTKAITSDLLTYKEYFDMAGVTGFIDYISIHQIEPIFYLATYILNKLLFGNFNLYVIFFTFLGYYLVFISIHKYWKYEKHQSTTILLAVFLFAFFHNYFFLSTHLLRQALAGSLFFYFFIEKIVNNNNKWIILIFAIFTHASSILLFVICFIPTLNRKLSLKRLIILAFITIGIISFGGQLISFLDNLTGNIPMLNYPFQRFSNMETLDNSWYSPESGEVTFYREIYYFLLIIMTTTYLWGSLKKNSYYLLNVSIVFSIILELFVFAGLLFMQMRLMSYVFLFVPFVLPYLFVTNKLYKKSIFTNSASIMLLLIFIFRFYRSFGRTSFEFAPLEEILLYPVFLFFL